MKLKNFSVPCYFEEPREPQVLRLFTSPQIPTWILTAFLLMGVVVLATTACGLARGVAAARATAPGVIGSLFTLVGLLAFERTGVTFDRRTCEMVAWSCWLWRERRDVHAFSEVEAISIVRYWNQSRRGPMKLYRIVAEVVGQDEPAIELVVEIRSAWFARRVSSRIARFIDLQRRIVDETRESSADVK